MDSVRSSTPSDGVLLPVTVRQVSSLSSQLRAANDDKAISMFRAHSHTSGEENFYL